ncbi:MAG: hypothetical protein M1829_004352 [Trizodia sp. TS-e1964]|nr:MAG: hypothetical protein M1829_004352 [Trizodia sp. TS-e1964]
MPAVRSVLQRATSAFRAVRRQPSTLRGLVRRRFASSQSNTTVSEPSPSVMQRLRKLIREYGWSALGVYLLLSALDFPLCYLLVRTLGTDRIGHWEHLVVEQIKQVIPLDAIISALPWSSKEEAHGEGESTSDGAGWGVEEATELNKGVNASIWTQLALAYAIHKSFIFLRVPLTAALTPKVVKVLRGWGWQIGKKKPNIPTSAK